MNDINRQTKAMAQALGSAIGSKGNGRVEVQPQIIGRRTPAAWTAQTTGRARHGYQAG